MRSENEFVVFLVPFNIEKFIKRDFCFYFRYFALPHSSFQVSHMRHCEFILQFRLQLVVKSESHYRISFVRSHFSPNFVVVTHPS